MWSKTGSIKVFLLGSWSKQLQKLKALNGVPPIHITVMNMILMMILCLFELKNMRLEKYKCPHITGYLHANELMRYLQNLPTCAPYLLYSI